MINFNYDYSEERIYMGEDTDAEARYKALLQAVSERVWPDILKERVFERAKELEKKNGVPKECDRDYWKARAEKAEKSRDKWMENVEYMVNMLISIFND